MKKVHWIKELEQEKFLLDFINKYLEKNDLISKEIFDSFNHELRIPVVIIKAYIDMFLKGDFGELTPKQIKKLERIDDNTNFLINVIFKMIEKNKKNG